VISGREKVKKEKGKERVLGESGLFSVKWVAGVLTIIYLYI